MAAVSTNLTNGINNSTVIPDSMKSVISQNVSGQTSNVEFGSGAQVSDKVPAVISTEITNISHTAIKDANKESLAYAISFGVVALISTLWLPGGTHIDFEKNVVENKKAHAAKAKVK